MKVSGLTINLPARDSESERVCARERELAGGAVGRREAGTRGRAGGRLQSAERRPDGEGQREATTVRGLAREVDRSGDTGTDFLPEQCAPREKPQESRLPFPFS